MPEISHRELDSHIRSGRFPEQCILIYGDSCLCDTALASILAFIFKGKEPGVNFDKADGLSGSSVGNAIEFLMTRSFFSGPKLVCITDARIFESKDDLSSLVTKAKQAYDKDDRKKSAKFLLKYLNESGSDLPSITASNFHEKLDVASDEEWVWQVLVHARENAINAEESQADFAVIEKVIDKGLPKNHYLVLITDSVDKRRTGFKNFISKALVINCQIPKGDRKADRDIQDTVFREMASEILAPIRKNLDPQAFAALRDVTGDDLRIFSANLKLLADFAGERQKITKDDVTRVLAKTRQDPIYEFTSSIASRDLESSLYFMRSILDSGAHPLQILASLINMLRRLLVIKSFCESGKGKVWREGMSYNDFQNSVMPAVTSSDTELGNRISGWASSTAKKPAKKAAQTKTDLLMAKGASPYPLYLLFQKASGFSMQELLVFFNELSRIDIKMKTSGGDIALLLEALVIKICTNQYKN